MFSKNTEDGYVELIEGIEIQTLVWGEKTLTAKFRLKKGSVLPLHIHPHEQTGYLVSGKMRFEVEGEQYESGQGDSWCISSGASHGAVVLEDSEVIEVFSPMREDYLPENLRKK